MLPKLQRTVCLWVDEYIEFLSESKLIFVPFSFMELEIHFKQIMGVDGTGKEPAGASFATYFCGAEVLLSEFTRIK